MPQSPPAAALHSGGPAPGQPHRGLHPLAQGKGPKEGLHRDAAVHRGQAEDPAGKSATGECCSRGGKT